MESMERLGRSLSRSFSRSMNVDNWGREDVFSRNSSHGNRRSGADEDEEVLRWAAIERLPTYNRLRTAILKSAVDGGGGGGETKDNRGGALKFEHREVDVRNLGIREREEFIKRVFRVADEDNEKFLRKFRERIDR
jgi:hypothetical protein